MTEPAPAASGPVVAVASVDIAAAPEQVWADLVQWNRHGDWVPLTTVRVEPGFGPESGRGVGERFVGRTALLGLGFDDVMEVTGWRPPQDLTPGRVEVVKLGRVLTGTAWFEVAAIAGTDPRRTRLTWGEEVSLAGLRLPSPLTAAIGPFVTASLRRVLRTAARDIESRAR